MSRVIGSYVHSDAITANKGAALAAAYGKDFADKAARAAFALGTADWSVIAETWPDLEDMRKASTVMPKSVPCLRWLALKPGEVGRIDIFVAMKEAALVKICPVTDFAAKTRDFQSFCDKVACTALNRGARTWDELVTASGWLGQEHAELEERLGERIEVREIQLLQV